MTGPIESLARSVAVQAHTGQVDKAVEPYIGHVERVVARLEDPLDRAVAWLHDVVEDTGLTRSELLRRAYPLDEKWWEPWARILDDVWRLTHRPNEPRADYYARVRTSARAVRVKLADIADNSDRERLALVENEPPTYTRNRLERKYREARKALEGER